MDLGVDILLVGYRSEAFLPRLREDIKAMTGPHTLHYWDNNGNTKTLSQAWNDLAELGSRQFIAVMNPDIALCPGWDARLIEALESDPTIGIATPDPFGSSPTADPMPSREQMVQLAAEYRPIKRITTKEVQFYLPVMRRTTFEMVCGFDERMRFYMQDSDIIKRLEEKGLRSVRVHSCPVWHQGSASTAVALERKELDQSVEYNHSFSVWREVREGRWKPWHELTDTERRTIRTDPRFARMGMRSTQAMDWRKS